MVNLKTDVNPNGFRIAKTNLEYMVPVFSEF